MSEIGVFGGAFDPPHKGHVEVARRAVEHFALERLVVVVTASPGHRDVHLDPATRVRLAELALPYDNVLDHHERTIDMLVARPWRDPLFLVGADEFCDFLQWKDPEAVLELARLGVATRPGFPRDRLEAVLRSLTRPDRVEFFEIQPWDVSSTEIRQRAARGESVDDVVPQPVADFIREHGLYRPAAGLH